MPILILSGISITLVYSRHSVIIGTNPHINSSMNDIIPEKNPIIPRIKCTILRPMAQYSNKHLKEEDILQLLPMSSGQEDCNKRQ